MARLPSRESLETVRLMVMLGLGSVLVLYGLFANDSETLMLGFAILGGEPMIRAGRAINGAESGTN